MEGDRVVPSRCARVPVYVAVEGAKGAGKTTVLRIVRQSLRDRGVRMASIDPTARGFVLHPLELLYRRPVSLLDTIAERVYAYRSNRQARLLQARRFDCDVVLGDRSFITTLATRWQRAETAGELAHFNSCRSLEWAIPIPDHVIYLDVPIDTLRRRVEVRARRYGRRDECVERLKAVHEAYAAIRQSRLRELSSITWHLVNGDAAVECVATVVLETVSRLVAPRQASGT